MTHDRAARSLPARAGAGVGLFSLVLGVVLLLMLGGLLVADQALRNAGREQARIDAEESANMLGQILSGKVEELGHLASVQEGKGRIAERTTLLTRQQPMLRRLWIVDSAFKLLVDTIIGGDLRAREHETTNRFLGGDSAVTLELSHRPVLSVSGESRHRLISIRVSLTSGEKRTGEAGAVYDPRMLFAPVLNVESSVRNWIAVRFDDVIVASIGARPAPSAIRTAAVPLGSVVTNTAGAAGTARWVVEVSHTQPAQSLRLTLWILGIVAAMFLSTGVLRERRQALRISGRSAELERLSTELLRANRMKSEFLANVSHELRTPLNAIVGFVDLLRDGVYGDLTPRQAAPVDRIAASATHLRHLVDQVLDIAKIAAGRLEVHPEVLALRPFVLNIASELESLFSERGLSLSIAVGSSLPRVRTDPSHLRQILVNLIGNAVKYTPTGSVIVRARLVGIVRVGRRRLSPEDPSLAAKAPEASQPWIALQVVDTGIGIAPADQERIFDEFEQVNAGPRGDSMHRGTGLGLAISRRLSRLLGGDIVVESQVGKGSTFTVWLPVNAADLEQEETASVGATIEGAARRA